MITAATIAAIIARMDAEPIKQPSRRILRFLDEVNMIYKTDACEKWRATVILYIHCISA